MFAVNWGLRSRNDHFLGGKNASSLRNSLKRNLRSTFLSQLLPAVQPYKNILKKVFHGTQSEMCSKWHLKINKKGKILICPKRFPWCWWRAVLNRHNPSYKTKCDNCQRGWLKIEPWAGLRAKQNYCFPADGLGWTLRKQEKRGESRCDWRSRVLI